MSERKTLGDDRPRLFDRADVAGALDYPRLIEAPRALIPIAMRAMRAAPADIQAQHRAMGGAGDPTLFHFLAPAAP